MDSRHAFVFRHVVKQPRGLPHDTIFVGADQFDGTGFNGLRPFGFLAQNQDWFAQRRGLLLNAARIGDQHVRAPHQVHKGHIGHRIDQVNVGPVAQ